MTSRYSLEDVTIKELISTPFVESNTNLTLRMFFVFMPPSETKDFTNAWNLSKYWRRKARAMKMHNSRPDTVMLVQIHRSVPRRDSNNDVEVGGPPSTRCYFVRRIVVRPGTASARAKQIVEKRYRVLARNRAEWLPEISVIAAGQTSNGRRGMPRLQIAFPEPLRESLKRPCFEWQTKEIRMYKFRFIFRFIISITYRFLIIYDPWFRIMSRLLFNRYTIYVIATVG